MDPIKLERGQVRSVRTLNSTYDFKRDRHGILWVRGSGEYFNAWTRFEGLTEPEVGRVVYGSYFKRPDVLSDFHTSTVREVFSLDRSDPID